MDENSDVFAAYVKYATELAVAVGADERAAAEQMKDVVDYEIELAKVRPNPINPSELSHLESTGTCIRN